jgi:hypothetical protein
MKYAKRKHEWLKWVSLEHVRTGFVNVEDEGKEKLLLGIGDKLCVS